MAVTNNAIVFKRATEKLNEVLFNVKIVDIATSETGNLFESNLSGIKIPTYKALVNAESRDILCVVSNKYRLIKNKTAIEIGVQAFKKLFPNINEKDLIPYKVITSTRKTFCHIDLIHKDVNFDVWKQETWLPFLRVTNSYNRMFALSFELGFVRKLCSNGVIFDKKTVKVKYVHTDDIMPAKIEVDVSKFETLEKEFKAHLLNLKRFHVKKEFAFPMLCKALNLNFNFNNKDNPFIEKQKDDFLKLKDNANTLAKEYSKSEGETAIMAMNVMTDIVSHQDQYKDLRNYSIRANGYYRKISEWMNTFTLEAEKRDFNIEKYLSDYLKYNQLLN